MKKYLHLTKLQSNITKNVFLTLALATSLALNAQDYDISFTGFGDSTVIDSIVVQNLTQETTLTLGGSDILNLVGTMSIDDINDNAAEIKIYPNPIGETGRIDLYSTNAEDIEINIFDLSGKLISTYTDKVYQGNNTYEISNYPAGMYIANISTNSWQKSLKFISQGTGQKTPEIKTESKKQFKNSGEVVQFNSTNNIVQMQYNDGDQLLLQGFAGDNITYFSLVPTETQEVNFEFVHCEDADGNNYPVVNIGTQTWMAINLTVSTPTGSWCYDDVPVNCGIYGIYGRLYDWDTLMNGEATSSVNPSGVQGLCPPGFHIPSDVEWTQFTNFLGGASIAGGKMKSLVGWNAPNTGASNISGFSGVAGGRRSTTGNYFAIFTQGIWWSSTWVNPGNVYTRRLRSTQTEVGRISENKHSGLSCRCLRD